MELNSTTADPTHRGGGIVADYDVQYDRDSDDWGAKRAEADRAAGRYETQAEAHDAARGFAERSGGGEVRDHRKDNNRIRNTDTGRKKRTRTPRRAKRATTGECLGGCRRRLRCAPKTRTGPRWCSGRTLIRHRVSAANGVVRMRPTRPAIMIRSKQRTRMRGTRICRITGMLLSGWAP